MTALDRTDAARPRFDRTAVGPLLADWACVAVFVLLGKENHGYEKGVTWFLQVWWPLALGILLGGLLMRIWTDDRDWPGRLLATIALGVVIGGPLRALTGRPVFSVFTVVALFVLCALMFGWRLVRIGIRQARATPDTA
jgi:hypothetical protein